MRRPLLRALAAPFLADVLACAFALVALAAPAVAAAPVATPAVPAASAAQFDEFIGRLEHGDEIIRSDQELAQALRRLAALLPPGDERRALRLRAFRCAIDDLGPPQAGLEFARAGLADATRLGETALQAYFGYCESAYLDSAGQTAQSVAPLEAAIDLARRQDDPYVLAAGLGMRGGLRSLLGEQAAALIDFLEVERLYRRAGRVEDAEASVQNIAIAYRRMGDYAKAREYLLQSTAFAEQGRYWGLLVVSMLQTGFLEEDQGHYPEAMAALRRAHDLAAAHDLDHDIGAAHMAMASVQVKQGEFAAAAGSLAAARAVFARLGDVSNEGMLQLTEGQVLAGRGRHAAALARFDAAAKALEASTNLRYQVDLHAARALSHEALGNFRAAAADLRRELQLRQTLADNARNQQSLLLRYQFDTARRDVENARLQAEKTAQQQQLDAAERMRRWQALALSSGGLLVVALLMLLLRQLARMRRIRVLAMTDALTGVANRRRIELFAQEAIAQADADRQPLAVLCFDIDKFKAANDRHGHLVGDQVLVRVAQACQDALRRVDLLGRMGGEEFLVVLPRTRVAQAADVAERLRNTVAALDLGDIAPGLAVTVSFGVAALAPGEDDLTALLQRADEALYRAKQGGRNRVEMAGLSAGAETSPCGMSAAVDAGPARGTPLPGGEVETAPA